MIDTETRERWDREDAEAAPVFGPNTIQTYSGRAYEFANPDPAEIRLPDIAHALGNMCRFAGHTRRFYSVGEHSWLVRRILKAQGESEFVQTVGLLHDAHEAYVWDCPRPLKPLLGDAFEDLANKADEAICTALGIAGSAATGRDLLPSDFHQPVIKQADDIALVFEANMLMHHGTAHWSQGYDSIPKIPTAAIPPLGLGRQPETATLMFLTACAELGVS